MKNIMPIIGFINLLLLFPESRKVLINYINSDNSIDKNEIFYEYIFCNNDEVQKYDAKEEADI